MQDTGTLRQPLGGRGHVSVQETWLLKSTLGSEVWLNIRRFEPGLTTSAARGVSPAGCAAAGLCGGHVLASRAIKPARTSVLL